MPDTTDPTPDFDGCNSECRKAGKHTLRWGGCEHAPKPEPTVSMSMIYKDPEDGYPSIGFDSYTVPELARLIESAVGDPLRAVAAARAIVHRNDDPAAPSAAVSPPPATDRAALRELVAEALMRWAEGNNDPQYARMRRSETVRANAYGRADAVLAALPPAADRAAVLREAADTLDGLTQQPDMTMPEGRWRAGLDAGIRELRRLAAGEWDEQQTQQDGAETPCCSDPTCTCVQVNAEGRCDCTRWEAAVGARQAEAEPTPVAACLNCRGSGLDPRYNGEYACPDCPAAAGQPPADPPPVAFSGKGRVWCLSCPRPDGEDVPVTIDVVCYGELCAGCGRDVVDVARATEQPPADTGEEAREEIECANCWRVVENRSVPNMGGPSRDNWVHIPGGFQPCFPQRGADSPRAEPLPAVVAEPGKEN